jgi:hypothetical protein
MADQQLKVFDLEDQACLKFVRRFRNAERFVAAFRKTYDLVTAYHGTNINVTESKHIKENGLEIASVTLLQRKAMDRFMLPTDDSLTQEKTRKVIDAFFKGQHDIPLGELNFTLDKDPLQEDAYQYLLFGPESLFALADQLNKVTYQHFRKRMMDFGTPTIIKAQVPVTGISDWRISGILGFVNDGGHECCILYHDHLPAHHILDLEQVPPPADKFGFLWI